MRNSVKENTDYPETIKKNKFFGVPVTQEQLEFINAIWSDDYDIIFCDAKAGTGKTLCATGTAKLLHDYKRYKNIIYIMAPYGEKKQGWLPGTIGEKSNIYFDAFYQALEVVGINANSAVRQEMISGKKTDTAYITCITDSFLRGVNMNDAVIIIDEAQNYTVKQLKTILTRIGKKAKVIVIGHHLQCDLESSKLSGFGKYIMHFREQERSKVCQLTENHRGWISQWADEIQVLNIGKEVC